MYLVTCMHIHAFICTCQCTHLYVFWCRWQAIINNMWTHRLSSNGVSLFTSKGAKPTEPALLSWCHFVSMFYRAIYIITICIPTPICIYMYMKLHESMCTYAPIYINMCMYLCMHSHVFVHVYICTYIH